MNKKYLPCYNEENWLQKFRWLIEKLMNTKLTIILLAFIDPLITQLRKKQYMNVRVFTKSVS